MEAVKMQSETTTLADILTACARRAGRLARYEALICAPPSYAADQLQTEWVAGWDEADTAIKEAEANPHDPQTQTPPGGDAERRGERARQHLMQGCESDA